MQTHQSLGKGWGTAPDDSLAPPSLEEPLLKAGSLFRQTGPQLGFQRESFPKHLSSLLHRVASCSRLSPGASLLLGSGSPGQAAHMYLVRGGQHQSRHIWLRRRRRDKAHRGAVKGKVHVRTGHGAPLLTSGWWRAADGRLQALC